MRNYIRPLLGCWVSSSLTTHSVSVVHSFLYIPSTFRSSILLLAGLVNS